MMDVDTFLTILYVLVDTFCKQEFSESRRPGPDQSLCCSEVITLCLFGQWHRFSSERDFYSYARSHLMGAFPRLPDRSQFNRLCRHYHDATVCFMRYLVDQMQAQHCAYEALDSSAVPVRNCKRRGLGWLFGYTDVGWSNRLGWYEGFHLLLSVNPEGIITGFGFGTASEKDQEMAETFLALRAHPNARLLSVGQKAQAPYVADTGFEGLDRHQRWQADYDALVICRPRRTSKRAWSKPWRRWLASIRQIIETVYDKLHNTFRLNRERPHHLDGFRTRLAAKIALHNFCIWLNRQYGRPDLAFAHIINW